MKKLYTLTNNISDHADNNIAAQAQLHYTYKYNKPILVQEPNIPLLTITSTCYISPVNSIFMVLQ